MTNRAPHDLTFAQGPPEPRNPMVRLDRIRHPYGPCPAALDAVAARSHVTRPLLSERLRRRLSEIFRIPAETISVFGRRAESVRENALQLQGPLVLFPPSEVANAAEDEWPQREQISILRGFGRRGDLQPDLAADLPPGAIALVDSPSDPLGALFAPSDAVRIARACRFLVVDERFAEFSGHSLLPLGFEFDNIVIIRSFDLWAGLENAQISWAVMSPKTARELDMRQSELDDDAAAAALASLDNIKTVEATLRLLRDERSRLYRLLRKLSFLDPVPSWGPFQSARVAIGSREAIIECLMACGIHVYAPEQSGLEDYIRFGIGSRSEMERLKAALLSLAPLVVSP
jgi:histidinol-phosphate aminotransferase